MPEGDPADSILLTTKKLCGLDASYTAFDQDMVLFINSVFSTLNQLGIGPSAGYEITDETASWSEYIGDNLQYNAVKTYMYLKVRMLFDPPTTSYVADAFKAQIQELEWRLNVVRENISWTDPFTPSTDAEAS